MTDEKKPEPVVQVLPYMGKPADTTQRNEAPYKVPFLTSKGTKRVLPLIPKERDDYEL